MVSGQHDETGRRALWRCRSAFWSGTYTAEIYADGNDAATQPKHVEIAAGGEEWAIAHAALAPGGAALFALSRGRPASTLTEYRTGDMMTGKTSRRAFLQGSAALGDTSVHSAEKAIAQAVLQPPGSGCCTKLVPARRKIAQAVQAECTEVSQARRCLEKRAPAGFACHSCLQYDISVSVLAGLPRDKANSAAPSGSEVQRERLPLFTSCGGSPHVSAESQHLPSA